MRDISVEADFDTLFKCVSLVNAARQTAKLKRRWPLRTVVVVAPENVTKVLQSVEDLFLEMTTLKASNMPPQLRSTRKTKAGSPQSKTK